MSLWLSRAALVMLLLPGGALILQLLGFGLLIGRQKHPHLAVNPRPQERHVGLGRGQRLRRRADQPLVHGHRLDRLLLRLVGRSQPPTRLLHLVPIALHDVTHLIALRVGQVELLQALEASAAPVAAWSVTALCEHGAHERSRQQECRASDERFRSDTSNHGSVPPKVDAIYSDGLLVTGTLRVDEKSVADDSMIRSR